MKQGFCRTRGVRLAFGLSALLCLVTPSLAALPPAEAYQLHCSGCHGMDGAGVEEAVPALTDLARLVHLPGGRAYLASVPGVAQAPLASPELAALLNWLLLTMSIGTDFTPYTAEEVDRWRQHPLRDPLAARPTDE
ncbi:MAG: c-type cytochrome [Myxococcota bacterium]